MGERQHTEAVGILTQFLTGPLYIPSLELDPATLGRSHARSSERVNVAAVCYRLRDGEPEFLLVRTRNGHWTFPKGGVDEDASLADAAAREAYEEAGVKGLVESFPFISYRHCKPRRLRSRRHILVHAHLCEVKRLVPPLERYRNPTWFRSEKAKRQLQKFRTSDLADEVVMVIDLATERILGRQ